MSIYRHTPAEDTGDRETRLCPVRSPTRDERALYPPEVRTRRERTQVLPLGAPAAQAAARARDLARLFSRKVGTNI